MFNLNELVEDNESEAYDIFEREIEKLSKEQLERLVVVENVYEPEQAAKADRDSLEIGAAEVTWREFFVAYRTVTGQTFVLDNT